MIGSARQERRFFIVAGETSGDQHGASLMAALLEREPGARFAGIGGARMRALGMESLYDAEDMALVGFWEVVRRAPELLLALRRTHAMAEAWKPTRMILIDYPGFNLRLARRAHEAGIPVTYYISPQLWAWREGRIASIREYVDQLLVIFPFEVDWYRERGVLAQFVGHPLLEEPVPDVSREEYLTGLGLQPERPLLTLFPGSRQQELERHLQLFNRAAGILRGELPELQVMLGLAPGLSVDRAPVESLDGMVVTTHRPRLALRYADAAIVASGTSTLEGAVWGVPMVVVYRVAPVSWWLGRRLVKLPFVGMVNILAGEEVVPEFLQNRAQPGPLAKAALAYYKDKSLRKRVRKKMAEVQRSLAAPSVDGRRASKPGTVGNGGAAGASQVAARAILEVS
ncbi:MAG: lipid-A-disaccharide synthase [Candidatus Neomarinimicrobiota bacterium]